MDFLIDTHSHTHTNKHIHIHTRVLYVNQEWKMFNLYMNLYAHASWPHLHTLTHSHSSRLHSQVTSQTVTHAYTLSYACGPHEHRHIHMHTHTCIHSHTECTKRTHTHSITHLIHIWSSSTTSSKAITYYSLSLSLTNSFSSRSWSSIFM